MNTRQQDNVVDIATAKAGFPSAPGAKRYRYPKSRLYQDYFCRAGDGTTCAPRLNLHVLTDPAWQSPLASLLAELKQDGHDVQAALIEFRALIEGVRSLRSAVDSLNMNCGPFGDAPTIIRHMLES